MDGFSSGADPVGSSKLMENSPPNTRVSSKKTFQLDVWLEIDPTERDSE